MKDTLLASLKLTPESHSRLGYFMKIEEIQVNIFLAAIKNLSPSKVIDVGSNIGIYSLLSKKYFPEIDVYAFEPTPSTFQHLKTNAASMEKALNFYNKALSVETGVVEFVDFGGLSGKNGISQTLIHGLGEAEKIIVECDTLDNLFCDTGQRIILKIDTEGHELSVLQGGVGLLEKNTCFLQIETGYGKEKIAVQDFLSNLGYDIVFAVGPDHYYSNIRSFKEENSRLDLLTSSIDSVVSQRWGNSPQWEQSPKLKACQCAHSL